MSKLSNILSNGPVIGLLGSLFVATLTYFIGASKFQFEKRQYHEKITVEKLKFIVTPLYYHFRTISKADIIFNDEYIKILKSKLHYLDKSLSEKLLDLKNLESKIDILNLESDETRKYFELRKTLENNLNKTHTELTKVFEKEFNIYKLKKTQSKAERIYYNITIFSKAFAVSFIVLVFVAMMLIDFSKSQIYDNEIFSAIFMFTVIIGIILFTIGITCLIVPFINEIIGMKNKKNGRFRAQESVLKTGEYKCRICGEVVKYYEYGKFDFCSHYLKKGYIIKSITIANEWDQIEDCSTTTNKKEIEETQDTLTS